jgi:hypothetical protein
MAATRRRHIDISSHLTHDELALLAEGKAGDASERLRAHLAHCKNCFQAYQDAVEFRARALAGEEPHAPPELVKNGRKVALRPRKRRGGTRAPRGRVILATAGGLAALAAVWIFLGPGRAPASHLNDGDLATITDFLKTSESENELPFRGEVISPAEIQRIVEELQGYAKDGTANAEDWYLLISAELVMGNLPMARHYLELAPMNTDERFLKLRAILEEREGH